MADSEIQPVAAAPAESADNNPKSKSKSKSKSESKKRPDDAVKLGCGGFFRRRKKKSAGKDGDAVADGQEQEQKSKAPIEKPKRPEQKPSAAVQAIDAAKPSKPEQQPLLKHREETQEKDSEHAEETQEKDSEHHKETQEKDSEHHKETQEKDSEHAEETQEKDSEHAEETQEKDSEHAEETQEKDSEHAEKTQEKDSDLAEASSENRDQKDSAEQPPAAALPGVVLEDSPHSELWSKIVSNSLVGIGVFNRAAVCNLTTGGVLATCPGDYAPTPGQVAALRDNFDTRGAALSSAGFGIGSTIYRLQEETSTKDIICGVNSDDTEGVLVTRTNTALLACAYSKDLDQAMEVLSEMRSNFIGQGM